MKFVFFGYDYSLEVAQRLLGDGHQCTKLYSFPCDGVFNFNTALEALALELAIPFQIEPPTANDILNDIENETDLFLSCGYPYKIPEVWNHDVYALNTHPSLLPAGRGLMPAPHIIYNHPETAGVSIHKTTEKFDHGGILWQAPLSLSGDETVDSYAARIAALLPDKISEIVSDLPHYWNNAKPQDKGSSFPVPDEALRTLDWSKSVADNDAKARAFGSFGCIGIIDGAPYAIFEHEIDTLSLDAKPGTTLHNSADFISVACPDGMFSALRFQKL